MRTDFGQSSSAVNLIILEYNDSVIALSGAKGYVGSALANRLAGQDELVCISPGEHCRQTPNGLEIGWGHPDLRFSLRNAKVYIHAAGSARGGLAELRRANVLPVEKAIACLPADIERIIHLSSINVYYHHLDPYGRAKLEGEEAWLSSPFYDRLIILRPALLYGPGDKLAIHRLIRLVRWLPVVPLVSDACLRPVYIDDFVDLLMSFIQKSHEPHLAGSVSVISGLEPVSYRDLVHLIAASLDKRIWCLPAPTRLLKLSAAILEALDLEASSSRLTALLLDKTWHDPQIWQRLSRPPVLLKDGLQLCLESNHASRRPV